MKMDKMYNLRKAFAIGAVCIASYISGCNTLMRAGEGFARLGERVYTGIKEDINSMSSNYKKEPYSLGNSDKADEKIEEKNTEASESEGSEGERKDNKSGLENIE